MSAEKKKVLATLDNLIATCKDGESGYRSAAEDIDAPELTELFTAFQKERAAFAAELLEAAHKEETVEERDGGFLAKVHRGWMNLKAAISRRDVSTVVRECERGESAALKDYEAALLQPLPPKVKALVEQQYMKVTEARARILELKAIATLNALVATCRDAEAGYRMAARHATDLEMKGYMEGRVAQRIHFASDLEDEIHRLGAERVSKGTLAAMAHRGILGLRASWSKDHLDVILAECERGEWLAAKIYERALASDLPESLKTMVGNQWLQIKESAQHLKDLHTAKKATVS